MTSRNPKMNQKRRSQSELIGSGTTGIAALNVGRDFIGIEVNPEYFAIAQRRFAEQKKSSV